MTDVPSPGASAVTTTVPHDLRRRVAEDLGPVRPLPPPWRRTMTLIPAGFLILVAVPLYWGWRQNLAAFDGSWQGFLTIWGLSALQTLVGLLIVGVALGEAIPGGAVSKGALAATLASAAAVVVGVTLVTYAVVPTVSPRGIWLGWAWECTEMATISALPGLALAAWLVSRALPSRPGVAGAIYGLGAGVLADSGMRLFCWTSEPSHVLVAHGGAIILMAVLGAISSIAIESLRGPAGRAPGAKRRHPSVP